MVSNGDKMKTVPITFTDEEHKKIQIVKEFYKLTWHELIIQCTDELAEKIDDSVVKELIE